LQLGRVEILDLIASDDTALEAADTWIVLGAGNVATGCKRSANAAQRRGKGNEQNSKEREQDSPHGSGLSG
jgi:hypothetical protein